MVKRILLVLIAAFALSAPQIAEARYPHPPTKHREHKKRVVANATVGGMSFKAWSNRTAWCESTGRWHINTGNGYYGGLQFSLQSWRAVGGTGYPHQHSRLEQRFRAVKLMRIQGTGAWPVCG